MEHENFELVEYDLTDLGSAISLIHKYEPHEIYNLAAQSFVGVSFDQPVLTSNITGLGALSKCSMANWGAETTTNSV